MEELLLWRWSTAVQITSALLVAVFFVVVGRSTDWRGVGWWVAAWVANGIALCVTWLFWMWQPGVLAFKGLLAAYLGSKTGFLLLLLVGTLAYKSPAVAPRTLRWLAAALLGYAVAGSVGLDAIDQIGVVQASLLSMILGVAAFACRGTPGLGWLGVGFLLRALLGVIEAVAYAWHMAPGPDGVPASVGVFLAAHSSFDTGAEWVIALGCVLALTRRAHAELQHVAERDPLTGLYNRRMLTQLLEQRRASGACLLFFDLDAFKRINDEDGHAAGDRSLERFARALEAHLGDAHAVLRFAGDEFLAVLPRGHDAGIAPRIERLRDELARPASGTRPLSFSVGLAVLDPGADPQATLRDADVAMYRDKARRR